MEIKEKKKYKLLQVKVPEGYYPNVFERVGEILYIYCEKSPVYKPIKFKR